MEAFVEAFVETAEIPTFRGSCRLLPSMELKPKNP